MKKNSFVLMVSFFGVSLILPQWAAAQTQSPAVPALPVGDQPSLVTPYDFRFAFEVGDQAGGPIRYNTRFPTPSSDPNPSSYYHAQAFVGANMEWAFNQGALQLGVLTRRDLAHRGIEGRSVLDPNNQSWSVNQITFRSNALSCGWIFGRTYREAPWRVSLASVLDSSMITARVKDDATGKNNYTTKSQMIALSLRGRGMWRIAGTGLFDLHLGPELHLPVYSKSSTTTDEAVSAWLSDLLDLKSSAAIGLVAEVGIRF